MGQEPPGSNNGNGLKELRGTMTCHYWKQSTGTRDTGKGQEVLGHQNGTWMPRVDRCHQDGT